MGMTTLLIRRSRTDRSLDQRIRVVPGGLTLRRHPRAPLPAIESLEEADDQDLREAQLEVRVRFPAVGVVSFAPKVGSDQAESVEEDDAKRARERLVGRLKQGLPESAQLLVEPALEDMTSGTPLVYDGHVVVRFRLPPEAAVRAEFEALTAAATRRELPYVERPALAYALTPNDGRLEAGILMAEACLELDGVENAYPVLTQVAKGAGDGPDPRIAAEEWHWGSHPTNMPHGTGLPLQAAWQASSYGKGQVIAVFERNSPIDQNHIQLRDRLVVALDVTQEPEPTSSNQPPLQSGSGASKSHATWVAGLCCASGIPQGTREQPLSAVGAAPRARLVSILASDGLGSLAEADAFYIAWKHSATVINCSWGLHPSAGYHILAPHVEWALTYVTSSQPERAGCTVVFSAGNGRASGQTTALSGYLRHRAVLVVTACRPDGKATSYANPGREILLAAPSGEAALSSGDDKGVNIRTLDPTGAFPDVQAPSPDGDYQMRRGHTSAACAMVSGAVALVVAASGGGLPPERVREILWLSADPLGTRRPGGPPDYDLGAGRLNVAAAVRLAASGHRLTPLTPWSPST